MMRAAVLADLPELLELEQCCFPEDAWSVNAIASELGRPGSIVRVAEVAGGVVGSAVGWVIADGLEVLRVAVHPSARQQGWGRQLLHALESAHPEVQEVWLEVREDNSAAIRLYSQAGYIQNGRRPRYYHDGCAALLYRKELPARR